MQSKNNKLSIIVAAAVLVGTPLVSSANTEVESNVMGAPVSMNVTHLVNGVQASVNPAHIFESESAEYDRRSLRKKRHFIEQLELAEGLGANINAEQGDTTDYDRRSLRKKRHFVEELVLTDSEENRLS